MANYVAVDLETTGLEPKKDKIIEIGALRVIDGRVEGIYETFVNPYRKLTKQIRDLTGIKDPDVEGASGIEELLEDFLAFAGDLPLLGHHVIFDYSFLKKAAVNRGVSFERNGIDTLKLARKFMPEEERKNLGSACAYFGIRQEGRHRALEDAKAAHSLYQEMFLRKGNENLESFCPTPLIYKVKKEQTATKRQKEHLQDLLKYHKISLTAQIDSLSRNEISRITDKIIAQYGRI